MNKHKPFRSSDGTVWRVDVDGDLAGSSNAMVVFHHPDGLSSSRDRYNWFISNGPEARSVTSHLTAERVMDSLDEPALERLFRRSMPVSRPDPLASIRSAGQSPKG